MSDQHTTIDVSQQSDEVSVEFDISTENSRHHPLTQRQRKLFDFNQLINNESDNDTDDNNESTDTTAMLSFQQFDSLLCDGDNLEDDQVLMIDNGLTNSSHILSPLLNNNQFFILDDGDDEFNSLLDTLNVDSAQFVKDRLVNVRENLLKLHSQHIEILKVGEAGEGHEDGERKDGELSSNNNKSTISKKLQMTTKVNEMIHNNNNSDVFENNTTRGERVMTDSGLHSSTTSNSSNHDEEEEQELVIIENADMFDTEEDHLTVPTPNCSFQKSTPRRRHQSGRSEKLFNNFLSSNMEKLELGVEEAEMLIKLTDYIETLHADQSILEMHSKRVEIENEWLQKQLNETQNSLVEALSELETLRVERSQRDFEDELNKTISDGGGLGSVSLSGSRIPTFKSSSTPTTAKVDANSSTYSSRIPMLQNWRSKLPTYSKVIEKVEKEKRDEANASLISAVSNIPTRKIIHSSTIQPKASSLHLITRPNMKIVHSSSTTTPTSTEMSCSNFSSRSSLIRKPRTLQILPPGVVTDISLGRRRKPILHISDTNDGDNQMTKLSKNKHSSSTFSSSINTTMKQKITPNSYSAPMFKCSTPKNSSPSVLEYRDYTNNNKSLSNIMIMTSAITSPSTSTSSTTATSGVKPARSTSNLYTPSINVTSFPASANQSSSITCSTVSLPCHQRSRYTSQNVNNRSFRCTSTSGGGGGENNPMLSVSSRMGLRSSISPLTSSTRLPVFVTRNHSTSTQLNKV